MGSGLDPGPEVMKQAEELGRLIAARGWVLLNGGRDAGVMEASARGAAQAGGLVIGVLPDEDLDAASEHLSVAIRTGMGHARNVVNVLSSDVVIAMEGGVGTLSEVAHAIQVGRTVICLGFDPGPLLDDYRGVQLLRASKPAEAIDLVGWALNQPSDAERPADD
jgi:uncharacterized protein (TIGR00725 family)